MQLHTRFLTMPYADKEKHKAYNSAYQLEKYYRRKQDAIDYLGGKCVDCGFTENLEFDHRDPKEKSFTITSRLTNAFWEKILVELDKCDLRCIACHAHVTAYQRLQNVNVLGALV